MAARVRTALLLVGQLAAHGAASAGEAAKGHSAGRRSLARRQLSWVESDGPGTQTVFLVKGGYGVSGDVNLIESHESHTRQGDAPRPGRVSAELRREVSMASDLGHRLEASEKGAQAAAGYVEGLEAENRHLRAALEEKKEQESNAARQQEEAAAKDANKQARRLRAQIESAEMRASAATAEREAMTRAVGESKAALAKERRRSAALEKKVQALENDIRATGSAWEAADALEGARASPPESEEADAAEEEAVDEAIPMDSARPGEGGAEPEVEGDQEPLVSDDGDEEATAAAAPSKAAEAALDAADAEAADAMEAEARVSGLGEGAWVRMGRPQLPDDAA